MLVVLWNFMLARDWPAKPCLPTSWVAALTATLGLMAAAFHLLNSPKPVSVALALAALPHPLRSSSRYHWPLLAAPNTVSLKFLITTLSLATEDMVKAFILAASPI